MAKISNRPRRTSVYNLSGAFELFGKSYDLVRQNFQLFMVLYSIPLLLALWDTLGRYVGDNSESKGLDGFFASFAFGPSSNSTFYKNAGSLMAVLIIPYLISTLLLLVLFLRTAQGKRPSFGELWRELSGNWLWLKLIAATIVMGILILLGLILLIIPGVILIWRLFFVPYVLIDKKTDIAEAIRGSWDMTRGYGWPIYSVLLVIILISITNAVPVFGPLVSFLLSVAYSVAPALRYQELKRAGQAA